MDDIWILVLLIYAYQLLYPIHLDTLFLFLHGR